MSTKWVRTGGRCVFKGLEHRRYLDTTGTLVTDAGVDELQLALPSLEVYNPPGNDLPAASPAAAKAAARRTQ
jgi:hypothetical protein